MTKQASYGAIPFGDSRLERMNSNSADDGGENPYYQFSTNPLVRTISEVSTSLVHAQFQLSEDALNVHVDRIHDRNKEEGTATIPSEVANMTKNLIGGGVLSLSGGMAMFANDRSASFSVFFWVILLGAVFGYFSLLIGKSCEMSLSGTYRECWERTVGQRGGLLVAITNTLDPLLGIFANASILAQSLKLLLEGINIYMTVVECLLAITIVYLLPLCLMRNLEALAPFSAMGMAAVTTAFACMLIRYLDGSYRTGGEYYDDIPPYMQPKFGTESRPLSIDALPFVCMVYTSFDMHYNSPRFYAELKNANVPRFGQVIGYSFGLTAIVYFSIAIVGFLTFGAHSDSYILNNYSSKDSLATVSRLAIGLCSLVSYPLNFIGVRDNCLDILGITDEVDTTAKLNVFTLLLLSIMTLASCFITDLGMINSVGGGTTVTLVCFIFPAFMFREAMRKENIGGPQWEVWLVMSLMVVGVVLGIIGVWSSIALA